MADLPEVLPCSPGAERGAVGRICPDFEHGLPFELFQPLPAGGDQPTAIAQQLVEGWRRFPYQTLLGVTGSGKTTMVNVIARLGRLAIVFANKTLAAQLASSKRVLPEKRRRVFRQLLRLLPARYYVPQRDLFIERQARSTST